MPQVFYKDGTPVPDEKLAETIAAGQAHARGRVAVRDASGTVGTIDASELGKPGYEPLTDAEIEQERVQKERGTAGQMALTAVEGAARGATLGLSDLAASEVLGDEYRKGARERGEVNPKLAIGSEIGGAIVPTLFSGGAAAGAEGAALAGRGASLASKAARFAPSAIVGRGGRAIERGIAGIIGEAAPGTLSRMAQRAAAVGASGAVEGGLYGAGNAVSQAVLDDTPITAEKVLSGFGEGALFGGLAGGGIGALGGLGSSALERIVGKEGFRAKAREIAGDSALSAVGFQGSDRKRAVGKLLGKEAEDRISVLEDELLGYHFDPKGPGQGRRLFTAASKAEDFVDDLELARRETGGKLGTIREAVDAGGGRPDIEGYLARVDDEVIKPMRESLSPELRKRADRVEQELSLLRSREAELGEAALDVNVGAFDKGTLRKESFDYLRSDAAKAADGAERLGPPRIEIYPGEGGAAPTMSVGDGRHRMSVAFERGDRSIPARVVRYDAEGNVVADALQDISLSNTPTKMWRDAVTELPGQKNPITFAEAEKFRRQLRDVFQPPSTGQGLPPPVPEHAEYLQRAERMLSEELDRSVERHLAANGLDTTEYAKLKRTYGAIADIEKVANRAALQQAGNNAISIRDHATGLATALGAMMSGNIGGVAYGAGAAVAHKIIRERGRSVLAVMADSVAKMDGRIEQAAKSLAGLAAAPRRAALVSFSAPDFDRTAQAVRAFASNPQAAQQALASPVEPVVGQYPKLAAKMQETLAGDYSYLAAKLPIPLGRANATLTPHLEKLKVPRLEQAKFMSIVAALENPAGVIEKIAAGELPREQIEALKARRPEIYNQMRTEAIKAFSIAKAPRGILERTRVSLAFDFNGDASLDPQTLTAIQASNRTAPLPPDEPAKDGQDAPARTRPLNPREADTLVLPSQKAIGS